MRGVVIGGFEDDDADRLGGVSGCGPDLEGDVTETDPLAVVEDVDRELGATGGGVAVGDRRAGGSPVPSLAKQWSHPAGGTHLKVVPCSWRATEVKRRTPKRSGRTRRGPASRLRVHRFRARPRTVLSRKARLTRSPTSKPWIQASPARWIAGGESRERSRVEVDDLRGEMRQSFYLVCHARRIQRAAAAGFRRPPPEPGSRTSPRSS